jgi:hypothetical protein
VGLGGRGKREEGEQGDGKASLPRSFFILTHDFRSKSLQFLGIMRRGGLFEVARGEHDGSPDSATLSPPPSFV